MLWHVAFTYIVKTLLTSIAPMITNKWISVWTQTQSYRNLDLHFETAFLAFSRKLQNKLHMLQITYVTSLSWLNLRIALSSVIVIESDPHIRKVTWYYTAAYHFYETNLHSKCLKFIHVYLKLGLKFYMTSLFYIWAPPFSKPEGKVPTKPNRQRNKETGIMKLTKTICSCMTPSLIVIRVHNYYGYLNEAAFRVYRSKSSDAKPLGMWFIGRLWSLWDWAAPQGELSNRGMLRHAGLHRLVSFPTQYTVSSHRTAQELTTRCIQHILFCINKSLSPIGEIINCRFSLCFQGSILLY